MYIYIYICMHIKFAYIHIIYTLYIYVYAHIYIYICIHIVAEVHVQKWFPSICQLVSCPVLHIFLFWNWLNLERALLQGTYMLMKHYDLSQHPDAELKFGAPGLEDLELEEACRKRGAGLAFLAWGFNPHDLGYSYDITPGNTLYMTSENIL